MHNNSLSFSALWDYQKLMTWLNIIEMEMQFIWRLGSNVKA